MRDSHQIGIGVDRRNAGVSAETAEVMDALVRSIRDDEWRQFRFVAWSTLAVLALWVFMFSRRLPQTRDWSEGWWAVIQDAGLRYGVGGFFGVFAWLMVCGIGIGWAKKVTPWKRISTYKRQAVHALAEVNDLKYVGSLLEIVATVDESAIGESASNAARASLGRNLKRISSDNQFSVNRRQADCLRRLLWVYSDFVLTEGDDEFRPGPRGYPRSEFDESLAVGCLHAYRFVSDPKALIRVRELAQAEPLAQQDAAWKVVTIAREVVPILEERVRQDEASAKQSLLKPAAPNPSPGSLLRPAVNAGGEASESLLHIITESSD